MFPNFPTAGNQWNMWRLKMLHRVNTSNILACARPQITVFMCTASYSTPCFCCASVASLLLQQGGNVDVPADGLSVEAAGKQVAWLVLFVPSRAAHHSPVTLRKHAKHARVENEFVLMIPSDSSNTRCLHTYHSVAARKPGQPHPVHVKQSDLTIVVWQSDDPLVGRDAYPERSDQITLNVGHILLIHLSELISLSHHFETEYLKH